MPHEGEIDTIRWLLDGDPAIRWQAIRDLTDETAGVVERERSRIASEGWGKTLLDRRAPQGWWNANDRGWMITMDALALLREMGLNPASDEARRAVARVKSNLRWESLGNRPYFEGETRRASTVRFLRSGATPGSAAI
jgi:hypothetical protein